MTKNKEIRPEITIIFPAHNEEEAISDCLEHAIKVIEDNSLNAEIIVIDNNSTDKTKTEAEKYTGSFPNLKIFHQEEVGYGSAYLKGFEEAQGEHIIIADADLTYDLDKIPDFVESLRRGNDFVMGHRMQNKMDKGAMVWHHKYIGNPVLSFLGRLFFKSQVKDFLCGMRGIKKDKFEKLNLQTRGMEFASEMVIKAEKGGLRIEQIPIRYYKRVGQTKLRSFVDGWRYLRFFLLYSPIFLFLIPGLLLFLVGTVSMIALYFNSLEFFNIQFVFHPIFIFSLFMIVGYQLVIFAGFAKFYAFSHLDEKDPTIEKILKYVTIEKAGILGIVAIILGIVIYTIILFRWIGSGLGSLDEIKNSIVALTLIVLGVQTISSSFMISILGIKDK